VLFLVKLDALFASSGLRLNRIAPTECPVCVIEAAAKFNDVRFGSLADIRARIRDVRFT
jgi:hypothetical protein